MSNEKEKTALDYYSKKIMKLMMYAITKSITGKQFSMLEIKLFQESKEMEKEQILDAYWEGGQDNPLTEEKGKTYYEKTYGGNK
jgi:hypothetical protein